MPDLGLPSSPHTLYAVLQTMLLEKLRVARRPAGEATFNIFYYLLACGMAPHVRDRGLGGCFGLPPASSWALPPLYPPCQLFISWLLCVRL